MTWYWVAVSISLAVGFVAGWYLWVRRVSRNRAIEVLQWIESSLSGYGHVTGVHWVSSDTFDVPVRVSKTVFRKANFRVQISQPELPLNWLLRRLRSKEDILLFSADLDYGPRFAMRMKTQRWFARTRNDSRVDEPGWRFEGCTPVVLTTRLDWQKEVTGMMQSLMACAHRENLSLEFSKSSPHLVLTMPLEKIRPGSDSCICEVLRTVAEGVSEKAS